MPQNVKGPFALVTERMGPLPVVNHFLDRLGMERLLEQYVPTDDPQCELPHVKALGILLRSIIVEREPIYRQQETVQQFAPELFGISKEALTHLSDDRLGRALDALFDADRGALATALVIETGKKFHLRFKCLRNDTTTIHFTGQYKKAEGRSIRGKQAPYMTYGYSKDHRPDLKQLLFILSTSDDGSVPIQFRCGDGNQNDSTTHIETWSTLRQIAGRPNFLYVADSKLCTRENMDYIDAKKGRFVTVMPRNRLEDSAFRKWIQTHEPEWDLVWDRPPKKKYGPRDRWWVFRDPMLSREAWPVIWVKSALLALGHEQTRREMTQAAKEALEELKRRLASPKSRLRKGSEVEKKIKEIFPRYPVRRTLKVRKMMKEEVRMRQQQRGRPGPDTLYVRLARKRWDITWEDDKKAIAYDRKSDGIYPLLTNDPKLASAQVLQAHKGQPALEKRFQQCKRVHEIAPVFLKNEGRIEALFFLYFVALMVTALIERELRNAMKENRISELPLYPEERSCQRPTSDHVLRLFSLAQRHLLLRNGKMIQVFKTELDDLQKEVLRLLGIPLTVYTNA